MATILFFCSLFIEGFSSTNKLCICIEPNYQESYQTYYIEKWLYFYLQRVGVYNFQFLVWLEDALCSREQRRNWLGLYPGNSLYIRLGKNCWRAFLTRSQRRESGGSWNLLNLFKDFFSSSPWCDFFPHKGMGQIT